MSRRTEERPRARRQDDERDPPRWRQSAGGSAAEKSLASDVRALPEPIDLDDLRLAQIRHRILHQEVGAARRPILMGWSWPRTVAFALAFLLLGGITTAMGARLYIRRLQRANVKPVSAVGTVSVHTREKPRRWRMAVRQPAELEVSLGPDGTEIAVVDGRAEISGAELPRPVTLTPGTPWNPRPADAPVAATRSEEDNPAKANSAAADPARVAPTVETQPAVNPIPVAVANPTPRLRARLAVLAPRPSSPIVTPAPASPPAPLADRPAASVAPQPFASPLAVGDDRSKPSAVVPPRLEPRAPVAPPESPAEAFLVAGALRSLRSDHAPRDALAKLDEHHRRFPRGSLQREATLARVEALLGLGRNDEARTALDSLTLGSTGADRQARLARAELRADRGDCAGAVDDLNGLLSAAANDDVAARALFRRAHCALRTHNLPAARIDLRDYLAHFPEGSRKAEVEALLRRLGE